MQLVSCFFIELRSEQSGSGWKAVVKGCDTLWPGIDAVFFGLKPRHEQLWRQQVRVTQSTIPLWDLVCEVLKSRSHIDIAWYSMTHHDWSSGTCSFNLVRDASALCLGSSHWWSQRAVLLNSRDTPSPFHQKTPPFSWSPFKVFQVPRAPRQGCEVGRYRDWRNPAFQFTSSLFHYLEWVRKYIRKKILKHARTFWKTWDHSKRHSVSASVSASGQLRFWMILLWTGGNPHHEYPYPYGFLWIRVPLRDWYLRLVIFQQCMMPGRPRAAAEIPVIGQSTVTLKAANDQTQPTVPWPNGRPLGHNLYNLQWFFWVSSNQAPAKGVPWGVSPQRQNPVLSEQQIHLLKQVRRVAWTMKLCGI